MAAKLSLPDVTLLTATSVDIDLAQEALLHCLRCADFGAVKMLCSALPSASDPRIEYIRIPQIDFLSYSRLILNNLNSCVETSHCLLVQADGFIVNPGRWRNEFLEYDYIGAPWPEYLKIAGAGPVRDRLRMKKNRVGNGGFSLRSKKLLELTSKLDFDALDVPIKSEDLVICHWLYNDMRKAGIRFAPPKIAARFSIEDAGGLYGQSLDTTFGFHGKQWLELAWIKARTPLETALAVRGR